MNARQTRAAIKAFACRSRDDETARARLLDLDPMTLLQLAADLRAGSTAWDAYSAWRDAGVSYRMALLLRRALALPKQPGRRRGAAWSIELAELAVTCSPENLPPIPGRIMAALECEPEDVRREAIARWRAMA